MIKSQLILIIVIIALGACDPFDMRLTVVNGSNDTIFFSVPADGRFNEYPIRVDSITHDTLWTHTDFVVPHDEMSIASMGKNSWKNHIHKHYKDSTVTVFIFDKELLKSVSPDSLVSNQVYSKRYSYKVKDLEKLNWRIEYKE